MLLRSHSNSYCMITSTQTPCCLRSSSSHFPMFTGHFLQFYTIPPLAIYNNLNCNSTTTLFNIYFNFDSIPLKFQNSYCNVILIRIFFLKKTKNPKPRTLRTPELPKKKKKKKKNSKNKKLIILHFFSFFRFYIIYALAIFDFTILF